MNFDSQANLTTCFGVDDVAVIPVTIGDLMVAQIGDDAMPDPSEYIMSRNGVDFIPSSMVPSTVKVGESVYYSEPLIEYAPENKACEAYRNLAKELMSDEG